MKNTKRFWDKISSRYDSQVYLKHLEGYNKTINMTRNYLKTTDVVLDFACGTGVTTIELSKNVERIEAIDISENMIDIAKCKSVQRDISNICFDVATIYDKRFIKESFDVVIAFNILYLMEDMDNVIQRIYELLKPNGIFISSTNCLGEKNSLTIMIQSLLSKIGVIPFIRRLKISELEGIIKGSNFSIMQTHKFNESVPNYYIISRKK
ncbi:class I SAM-dependent methyltransferase [Abyssisolibacter fermentans]|uniref:class I SAM-dependent methyltransferase n=1 Tax=Abyssisolibacter fermentans TaxID=1766203 RepID=UPI0008303DB1|nr:class I SAM-dependent methyltransferase [Abyssisolibacter fermentans]